MSIVHRRTPGNRLTAVLLGIGLTITGATQLVAPAQAAAPQQAGSLTVTPASAIAGEPLTFKGNLPPKRARTVVLQRKQGTTWVKVAQKKSTSLGRFTFSSTTRSSTTRYRVFAPRATLGGSSRPPVVTPTRTVVTQVQSATLALPNAAEVGDVVTATGTFTPARSGRTVQLQLRNGLTWDIAATGTQDALGKTSFPVNMDTAGVRIYRVVTRPWHGAALYASGTKTITVNDTTAPGPVTGLSVTGTTTSSITLSWTNPADADFTGVMIRRATGSTPPATAALGTLVTDKADPGTSHTDSGRTPGTQYSYALFAHDAVPNNAAAATTTGTTAAATTSDWSQGRHDSEHRGWSPAETTISSGNVTNVGEEWTAPGGSQVIAGNLVYVVSTEPLGSTVLTAYNLTTSAVSWQISTGTCPSGPVSVTTTLVILGCGAQPRAYERGDDHGLVWDTLDTDPGQSLQNHLVLGDTLVAWSQDRVALYQLSDGQRVWQQLLPSGANSIFDVAASGNSVVVAYDDRLRALSAATGSQQWSDPGVLSSQLVVADGWVYTNNGSGVSRYSLAAGTAGWSVLAGQDIYRIEAADADTIYVWNAVFDFGSPSPSVLRALNTTDGSQRWEYNVPSRIGSVAVTGDLVWVTSTEIFSQGRGSDLIALNRATGGELKLFHFDDNMYGWTDVSFGAGKAIVHQGGSSGGTTPHTLRIFGLAGPRPTIATRVLPIGRVGSPYSFQLANESGTSTWSVQSGALPAGLSLSASGLVSGTPTGAQPAQVLVRATGANGRTHERSFSTLIVASVAPSWLSGGRDATRNALEPGTGTLDLDDAPLFAFRWKTAAPGTTTVGGDHDVVTSGNTMYSVSWDGVLRAWDTTGTTANRAAFWSASPASGGYVGALTLSGDRLLVRDDSGRLHAVQASDGAPLWTTPDPVSGGYEAPLVVGTSVFVRDLANQIRGFSTTNGDALWGGAAAPVTDVHSALSSDGTRIYSFADCELYAVNVSNGSVAWHTPVIASTTGCFSGLYPPGPPIVLGGKVYATEPAGKMIANAATGAPEVRFAAFGANGGTSVVVGGLWIFLEDDRLVAVDTTTGAVVWTSERTFSIGTKLSATGDLILAASTFDVRGVSRLTGETAWDGGAIKGVGGSAVVGNGRIFVATEEGVRAFGPL